MNGTAALPARPLFAPLLPRSFKVLFYYYATVAAVVAGTVAFWTDVRGPVLLPLAVLTATIALFLLTLVLQQDGGAPFFQLGGFFALMTYLYAAYPIVVYIARDMVYDFYSDDRFRAWQPTPPELGTLSWWYAAFLGTFAVVYLLTARHSRERLKVIAPPRGIVIIVIAIYVASSAAIAFVMYLYPYDIQTYGDAYLAFWAPPPVLRQILSTLAQMMPTLLIITLAALFTQYRRRRLWIALLIGWMAFNTITMMHGRTQMFVMLFVAAWLYHNMVRRISMAFAVAGILVALAGLAWLGAVRNHEAEADNVGERALLGSSEFEVILANAYHLKYIEKADGVLLRNPAVYFGDFVALAPQQLVPFPKQTKAGWYLSNYWAEFGAMGGGLAFGVLAEAITGFGIAEIFARAAITGLVLGLLQRRLAGAPITFWTLVGYLWLTVLAHHIVRNTTFGLVQWSIYQLLLPIVALRLLYFAISRGRQRVRRWRVRVS